MGDRTIAKAYCSRCIQAVVENGVMFNCRISCREGQAVAWPRKPSHNRELVGISALIGNLKWCLVLAQAGRLVWGTMKMCGAVIHDRYGGALQKSLPALPRLSLKSPHIAENWAHSKTVLGDLRRHWAASNPLPYQP